jgi:hypothetical protein
MSMSAAALILATVSGTMPGDITPMSLSIEPRVINLGKAPYDWNLQQRQGLKLADNTAVCDTVSGSTNNGQDTAPDCRFD